MRLDLQPKLLRVLQEREFERVGGAGTITSDVRVVATTSRTLASEVTEGRLRQDLYYRLSVFPIEVPPLRDRLDDIPLLAHRFAARAAARASAASAGSRVETFTITRGELRADGSHSVSLRAPATSATSAVQSLADRRPGAPIAARIAESRPGWPNDWMSQRW